MPMSRASHLLLVALVTVGLCQSCTDPTANIDQSANAEVQTANPDTLKPAPALDASLENAPADGSESIDSEQPAVCDLTAQLAQLETTLETTPVAIPAEYSVINEQEAAAYQVVGDDVFQTGSLPSQTIDFDERALLNVLQETRTYFSAHGCEDPKILQNGVLGTQDVTISDVVATLDFMIKILNEDIAAERPTRLKNSAFINENFEVIRWLAYDPTYLDETRARITKYAVFTHEGSRERTEIYNTPVYKIKDGLEDEDFITQYTKQEALSGIFEPGGAEHGKVETLAYLTREGFEDALLQGTAYVTFADGSTTYFNVDKNNGIAYVPGLAQRQQERFWYFKEVTKLNGYGLNSDVKIPIEPGVTFAGDVLNIGLGKIVAIEDRNQNIRLGIIADTGGAFLPNLHQLDFFAGVFPDRTTYQQAVSDLPEYTKTYFLLRKESAHDLEQQELEQQVSEQQ